MTQSKLNGIFYTPSELADFLVKGFDPINRKSILDPAYGEGSLLLAAERIAALAKDKGGVKLHGCGIKPVNGLLTHLPRANLKKVDFFKYEISKKYDLVLTNPPYVRHHIRDNKITGKYRADIPELKIVSNTADLWAFFLVKSVRHLTPGGSVGAILPWAFLQADYAQVLREWLYSNFQTIEVLALTDKYFEDADERVVLVWLKNFALKCTSLKLGASKSIDDTVDYFDIPYANWVSKRVLYTKSSDLLSIVKQYQVLGFDELKRYANVRIGVVTGDVKYFILETEIAKALGFTRDQLLPIISSVKDVYDYLRNGSNNLKKLLMLDAKDGQKFKAYINRGLKQKVNHRRHSQLRKPWYSVKIGSTPDAFFPYRISKIPFIIPNTENIQSTNSIHRLYYKNCTATEKKWIIVSILSDIGQLSLELSSKTYGRGMLKIEPSNLQQSLVLKRNDRSIDPIYNRVLNLLKEERKEEAASLATTFINHTLGVNLDLTISCQVLLKEMQQVRLSKSQ